jgi:hypothetical protein
MVIINIQWYHQFLGSIAFILYSCITLETSRYSNHTHAHLDKWMNIHSYGDVTVCCFVVIDLPMVGVHRFARDNTIKNHFGGLPGGISSPLADEPPQPSLHDDDDDDSDKESSHHTPVVVISTGGTPKTPAPTPSLSSASSSTTSSIHASPVIGPDVTTRLVTDLPSFGLERSVSSVASLSVFPVENKRPKSSGTGSDDEVPRPPRPLQRLDTGASPTATNPSPNALVGTGGAMTNLAAAPNDQTTVSSTSTGATLVEWPFPRVLRTRTRARTCVIALYVSTLIVTVAQISVSIYYLVWLDKSLV